MRTPDDLVPELRAAARDWRRGHPDTVDPDVLADLLGEAAWWLDRLGGELGDDDDDLPDEDPQFDDHYEGHGTPPEDWL